MPKFKPDFEAIQSESNILKSFHWYDMLVFPFIPFRISRGLTNSPGGMDESNHLFHINV